MTTDLKTKWFKSPIDKNTLKKLMEKSDAKALRHVSLHLSISISTSLFALYFFHNLPWFVTLAAVYMHGTFYNFLGMFIRFDQNLEDSDFHHSRTAQERAIRFHAPIARDRIEKPLFRHSEDVLKMKEIIEYRISNKREIK